MPPGSPASSSPRRDARGLASPPNGEGVPVQIERIHLREATDEQLRASYELSVRIGDETRPEGDPIAPFEQFLTRARHLPSEFHAIHFIARDDDGASLAQAALSWEISDHNQHLIGADVSVLPEHRGRGIARELLHVLVPEIEATGRTMVNGHTTAIVPAGEAFCTRLGAKAAYRDHTNRLVLERVDREMIASWIAKGPSRAPGYSLVWHDGPYGDLAERVIPVLLLLNHAPREDLDMEDWKITPEEMREWERMTFSVPNERWSAFARHDATDTFIGFTEVMWNPAKPATVSQMGTAVDPEHRGHALGKWLKAAMIDRILRDRPQAMDVRTGNADSNDPMLGINTQLGFEPFRAHIGWQIPTEQLRAYRDGR